MVRKIILVLLFSFAISFSPVYADSFFPDGDISQNQYFDALGISISELAINEECPNCVVYDEGSISGSVSSDVLNNSNIYSVTEGYDGYGLRRLSGILDEVSVPPGSKIDFVYWGYNATGGDVYIDKLKVFLTHGYSYQGDWRNVLNVEGEYQELPLLYIAWNYPRIGIAKEYEGLGWVQYSGVPLNPFVLDNVLVNSPLKFVSWKYIENLDKLDFEVEVENTSDYEIPNVLFKHKEYSEMYNFSAKQTHTFIYSILAGGEIGLASIYNPNSRKECTVYSESYQSKIIGDSTPLVGVRSDNGTLVKNYVGSRVLDSEIVERFCITRIPYQLFSGEMKPKQESVERVESSVDIDIPEVKGIKALPQTSYIDKKVYMVIVVTAFLWYYVFRRLRYENKSKYTILCKKSCKNALKRGI